MNRSSDKGYATDLMLVQVTKDEIRSSDINPTLQKLNLLKADKASAQRYQGSLTFEILGFEDSDKSLFDIREVQKFMQKLDKEFPYWFYFLSNYDSWGLDFILLSISPHFKDSSGKWRVERNKFEEFMSKHDAALEAMCNLAEVDEEDSKVLRSEMDTYFRNLNDTW